MKQYIISIDQSTVSTKTVLLDEQGDIVCKASFVHKQYYPQPEWIEQDACEIYDNTVKGILQVLKESAVELPEIKALAITNQTGAFVIWDKMTGEPVFPVIGWQCGRGKEICDGINPEQMKIINEATSCMPSAFQPLTKLAWLFKYYPDLHARAKAGEILFGSMDTWLVWKLTNGKKHVIDYGNACNTQMLNIVTLQWAEDVLALFDFPLCMFPVPTDSDGDFGTVEAEGLPKWPISGVIGDSNAALYSQCGFNEGSVKVTYGTGASILFNKGHQPVTEKNGLFPVVAWKIGGEATYVLEGTTVCAGAVINWLIDDLKLIENPKETETLCASVPNTEGVYFVPAFTGLGTPFWDSEARACIVGMGRGTKKAHIVRAALESIAYQVTDMIKAGTDDDRTEMLTILVDGGVTKNSLLMQFQADISRSVVIRNEIDESSAVGAAYVAGVKAGIWKDQEQLKNLNRNRQRFETRMDDEERERLYSGWKKAVSKAIT